MKIMVISNGWGINTIAGGEYHILKVIGHWSQNNDIILVMPRSGYEISKKIIPNTVKLCYSSSELHVDNLITNILFYLRRMMGGIYIKSEKPDVVVAASHFIYDVFPAYILSKRFRSKLVIYNHSVLQKTRKRSFNFYNLLSLINEKLGLHLSKNADSIFIVNEDTRKYLLENNFKRDLIFETANGIDKNELLPKLSIDKAYDCCYCGRIAERKGIFDIIEIWKQIVKIYPNSKIVLIGNGPDFDNIKSLIEKNGLETNIILTGFLFGREKIEKIVASRIFVFPSYEEGWGIAISEALSYKLAVVCYELEAYTIFKDGVKRVNVGDIDMMTKEIIHLLKNPNNIDELSDKGFEVISSFKSWEDISERQFLKLQEVINANNIKMF
jgi:glycosyltransferase involved in cell wall biosynthesis